MVHAAGSGGDVDATVVNAMFREAVTSARDVILQSRMFTRLGKRFDAGAINVTRSVVSTDEARLHRALNEIAVFACFDARTQTDNPTLEFLIDWKDCDGEQRPGISRGADLLAAGVAVPMDDGFTRVRVCEPVVILALLKIVPRQFIINHLLRSWRSVAFVSSSTNGYLYELILSDCFMQLFAAKDAADIPGLCASSWVQKFGGRWRLADDGVLCQKIPSLAAWLRAGCCTVPATTFVLPHENDGPDLATLVSTVASVAAQPTAAVRVTAPPAAGGKTAGAEPRLLMLVHANLGAKYRAFETARRTVSRETIGRVKAATGKTWERTNIQNALTFPVLGVVVDPVSRLRLNRARALSGHVEWQGHSDFLWVMDKEYFEEHPDIAKIFRHEMVTHLYECAANKGTSQEGAPARKSRKRARRT